MDYHSLIPELQGWETHNNRPFTPGDWIGCIGNFEHAIGYLWLFWPTFVLHDDMLLGEGFSRDVLKGFLAQENGNKSAVEAVMNHIHLSPLFVNSENPPTAAQIQWLGERLQQMWLSKLTLEFPGLHIKVEFYAPEDPEDLEQYQVTAFQVRQQG